MPKFATTDWTRDVALLSGPPPVGADVLFAEYLRRAWRLLLNVAKWIDELLDEPRVWRTVEALAAELRPGRLMHGTTACRIMDEAWGSPASIPAMQLPRKWRRRLLGDVRRFRPTQIPVALTQ